MILHSLIKGRKHVWSQDSALDKDDLESFGESWTAFLADGDPSKLPIKEGAVAAVFHLQPLSRRQFMTVFRMTGLEQVNESVAYGLAGVTGFQVDGVAVALERKDSDSGKRLSAKSLDAIFDPILFAELAARIIEISRIDPTRG